MSHADDILIDISSKSKRLFVKKAEAKENKENEEADNDVENPKENNERDGNADNPEAKLTGSSTNTISSERNRSTPSGALIDNSASCEPVGWPPELQGRTR